MKKGIAILAGVLVLTGGAFILNKAPPIETVRAALLSACPTGDGACDGGKIVKSNGKCTCITSSVDPVQDEIEDVDELPDSEKFRMLGCCDEDDNKWVDWRVVTAPVGSACIQILNPRLHSGRWMRTLDLGHVEDLNEHCCGTSDGPVTTKSSGQCPQCSWSCKSGHPSAEPHGCDAYCGN